MKQTNLLKLLAVQLAAISLIACTGGGDGRGSQSGSGGSGGVNHLGNSNNPGFAAFNLNNKYSTPLTIADSATIPFGKQNVKTYFFVRNNSNVDMVGVKYNIEFNQNEIDFTPNENSLNRCGGVVPIHPGQICAIPVRVQAVNGSNSAQVKITAKYSVDKNGAQKEFVQTLNFNTNPVGHKKDGISISSDLNIAGNGNSVGLGVVYISNNKSADEEHGGSGYYIRHEIENLTFDKPGIKTVEVDYADTSHHLTPYGGKFKTVLVQTPIFSKGFSANVSAQDIVDGKSVGKISSNISIGGGSGKSDGYDSLISIDDMNKYPWLPQVMTIRANSKASISKTLLINNNGDTDVNLKHEILNNIDNHVAVAGDSICKANSRCEVKLTLAPVRINKTLQNVATYSLVDATSGKQLASYAFDYIVYALSTPYIRLATAPTPDDPLGKHTITHGGNLVKEGYGTESFPIIEVGGVNADKRRMEFVYVNDGDSPIWVDPIAVGPMPLHTREYINTCKGSDGKGKLLQPYQLSCKTKNLKEDTECSCIIQREDRTWQLQPDSWFPNHIDSGAKGLR